MGVTEAASGRDGLALALADTPDAILLDVMMPAWTARPRFRPSRRAGDGGDPGAVPDRQGDELRGGPAEAARRDRRPDQPFDPMTLPAQVRAALGEA